MKILVVSEFCGTSASSIGDYLYSFNAWSPHDYYYVHSSRILGRRFPFEAFDVLVFFWSLRWPYLALSDGVVERIASAPGLKVMFRHDEYQQAHGVADVMGRMKAQVICTLAGEQDHELFYPRSRIPSLRAVHTVLTGYVPRSLEAAGFPPHAGRPIDVGYRSRICPYYLGDLAQEKQIIAERFQQACRNAGLRADISVWHGDRLNGSAWRRFLASCRTVLGTESGASVVDWDGAIQRNVEQYVRSHPEAEYADVRQRFFANLDGRQVYRAISPRVFESAAMGNALVMYDGEYSGIVRPDEHYIAVRKDHSNLADVVERIQDLPACEDMARRTHRELVASGRYSYRTFVAWWDRVLEEHVPRRRRQREQSKTAFYAWNFAFHGQGIIPRGDGFVRLPNVDAVRIFGRNAITRAGWRVVAWCLPNRRTIWGLRAGVQFMLVAAWNRLSPAIQFPLRPFARVLKSARRGTIS